MKKFVLLLLMVIIGLVNCTKNSDSNAINQKHYRVVMQNLDGDFSACSQFYSYVCSKWLDKHLDGDYTSMMDMIHYSGNVEVKKYLENTSFGDMPNYAKLVKNFYKSCKESQEYQPLELMHRLEKEENMTWALLTPVKNEERLTFDWPSTMATFRKYGFNDMLVDQWSSIHDDFEYVTESNMESLNTSITLPADTIDFMELWQQIDEFENKFAEVKAKQRTEKVYKFNELPYGWLKKYLTALVPAEKLYDNRKFRVRNTVCMEGLDKLLQQYDDKFLCRYLEVRFLLHLEKANRRATPHECLLQSTSLLNPAMEGIHLQLHPELLDEIPQIKQMFENIVKSVNKTLQMAKDEAIVPQEIFTKLGMMKLQVGNFPPLEKATEILTTFYKNLNLQNNDYYGNYLKLLKFHYELESQGPGNIKLETFSNTATYSITNWDTNLSYDDNNNLLRVPFAVLRPPMYHLAYERIFKHSSLGVFMALRMFDLFYLMDDSNTRDVSNLSYLTSLNSALEVFLPSLQSEVEAGRLQTMFNMTSVQQLKQMFFINAVHCFCENNDEDAEVVNYMLMNMSEFIDAFDCKFTRFYKKF
ncbi:uncharacterized protein [Musca autumnalis]|uniref:uncharacterized protein n=1 Tax=Musca autumnalis TaxID=221902 RepID=UPI003CF5702C